MELFFGRRSDSGGVVVPSAGKLSSLANSPIREEREISREAFRKRGTRKTKLIRLINEFPRERDSIFFQLLLHILLQAATSLDSSKNYEISTTNSTFPLNT